MTPPGMAQRDVARPSFVHDRDDRSLLADRSAILKKDDRGRGAVPGVLRVRAAARHADTQTRVPVVPVRLGPPRRTAADRGAHPDGEAALQPTGLGAAPPAAGLATTLLSSCASCRGRWRGRP